MTPGGKRGTRPGAAADIDAVVALDRECFGAEAWSPDSWAGEFERLDDTRVILIAETAGELVGYVVLIVPDHPDDPVDLARVAVSPAHRRTGIGGQLLEAALVHGRTTILEVAEGNKAARKLYQRFGFVEISRRAGYYPDGEDALILQRKRPMAGSGSCR